MRPNIESVLDAVVMGLNEKMATMTPGPDMGQVWAMKTVIGTIRRDWDDAASMRVGEIDTLQALLQEGANLVPEDQQEKLRSALQSVQVTNRDLRISALERTLPSTPCSTLRALPASTSWGTRTRM